MAGDFINGEVPTHWEFTTLGEVCRRGGGFIQTGPFGSQLHASDYVSAGVPFVMPTNIGDNRIIETGVARITEGDANRLNRHRLEVGDIVYSRRGDVEKRALIREPQRGWLCGSGCVMVRFGSGVVDPQFASFFLGHPSIRDWIVRHAVGATMPNLNTSIVRAVPFALPPLSEQEAIAAVLGALDDKIALNRRMNATLEATARALFQSWFVDFDPVRAKLDGRTPSGLDEATAALFPDEFQESELGHIPDGWKVTNIGDTCAAIFSGGTPSTKAASYWGGNIPWLSSGETRNTYIIETEKTITTAGVENSSTRLARAGCTVIAGAGQGHTRGQTSLLTFESYINQSVVALSANQKMSSDLFLFLDLARRYDEFRQLSDSHSSRGSLTTKLLASVKCVLPPHGLVGAFDKSVRPIVSKNHR